MEEQRADASESADDPLGRLAKRLLDSSLDDVDLEESSAPAVEGAVSPLPPPLLRLRDYAVVSRLGRGGMGAVYLAHQRSLPDKQVALKVLPGLYATDPERLARFRNEAVTASRLNHPNVVAVLDMGYENDVHFLVQELVEDGRTLGDLIRETRDARTLPRDWYRTTAELFAKIAEALAAVHAANVLHRDIKPSNILLTPLGEPKVGDFGLAKDLEGVSGMTRGGAPGTLNYKSPEQLDKSFGKVDQRSDVFSLGVTMYEALTLARLFPGDEPSEVQPAILGREIEDLRQVRPGVPKDLSTLCRKCLEKRPEKRYQTMAEVAADLRRYLGNEPILAKEPSRCERMWKWSRRNPGVATGITVGAAALVIISVVALVAGQLAAEKALLATEALQQKGKAETNATLANDKASEALREKGRADAKVREFDQLAGVVEHKRAIDTEADLYPAWPGKISAMKAWLKSTDDLLAKKPGIENTVRDLEARALPATAEEQEADRRSHPQYAAFELLSKRIVSWRYAQAIRAGKAHLVEPKLHPKQQALDSSALKAMVWLRVAPPAKDGKAEERTVWGEEAFGLACARAAVANAVGTRLEHLFLDSLALALWANGQDAEAKAASASALTKAPVDEKEEFRGYQRDLEMAITRSSETLAEAEKELAALTTAVNQRRTFRFELESQQVLHDSLAELLGNLGALADKERVAVDQRLGWARQIQGLSLAHPNARFTWDAVRSAIASNPKYTGQQIELREQDITGLVPIGENPVTHLWEFYELGSAWDGNGDAKDVHIPQHDPTTGAVTVTGETGIVFVLLPGGTFTMGAQKVRKGGPNYDSQARYDQTPHEVTLAPFFLARHEMTKGQWKRLSGGEEPSWFPVGVKDEGAPEAIGYAHPVEQVDWAMCDMLLTRHGLALPTEAQWEYGCRGGTETPWWPGQDAADLSGCANVLDQKGEREQPGWGRQEGNFDDGRVGLGPVGCYRANSFGLYDVHGNVWEWCFDWYGSYTSERPGDGLRPGPSSSGYRVYRGGSFSSRASSARCAIRYSYPPSIRNNNLGLRPSRTLRP